MPTDSPVAGPGRPYSGAEILVLMRQSTWPNPEELLTEALAEQVASAVWTFDGQPYASMQFRGACGVELCGLDVAGRPAFVQDPDHRDLVHFEVNRASGRLQATMSDLHGYPPALDDQLDELVRELMGPGELSGRRMVGAVWLPPPDFGQFVVSYRAEGDRDLMSVRLDVETRRIISVTFLPLPEVGEPDSLLPWIERAFAYVATLPPKERGGKR